ncbi:MAG: two-component system sensor histidine kinase KdbD, partial [Magnetococcales bacterium]|nr:two-component system sensor histidine kinase KdbD [Magnetococcales bacterium]
IAEDLPLLEMDGMLIERVFCNLLENTTRHTPIGSRIEIEAHVDGQQVVVLVMDNGPGLPPGQEEAIFAKFVRGSSQPSVGGVGLGLAIVRSVIEAHAGTIYAENRPEGGTKFEFHLPITECPFVIPDMEKMDD